VSQPASSPDVAGLDEATFDEAGFEEPGFDEPQAEATPAEAPRGVLVRRPKTTVFTVLLGVSAAVLAIGCLILILEIWQYGPPWTFPWKIPTNLR